jgi:protein ImuB
MDAPKVACVDIPALPLQLVFRAQPGWRLDPIAVVEAERPLAAVQWLNQPAQRAGIRRGMKLGQARALCCQLRAETVPERQVEAAIDELFEALTAFSPAVEPAADPPGLFWLDPSGMKTLFGTYLNWAQAVYGALAQRGFRAAVVVGFSRYLAFAIAKTTPHALVLSDPAEERRLACEVRLGRLDLPAKLYADLALLGIDTLGQLLNLPQGELKLRYGSQAAELHDRASGQGGAPLRPRERAEPLRAEQQIDPPDDNHTRLLFALKGLLDPLIDRAAAQGEAVAALQLVLRLDHALPHPDRVALAAPTLNAALMLDLIRLRLGASELAAPVEQLELQLETVPVHPSQLGLLYQAPRRDLDAAARAIARIQAAFGPDSVTRARLRNAYLPEAAFCWEPISRAHLPKPTPPERALPLVRRVFTRRIAPPTLPFSLQEGTGLNCDYSYDKTAAVVSSQGMGTAICGPYRIAGGWWKRRVERDYYFVETADQQILWVYYDRPRNRWVLHGVVE